MNMVEEVCDRLFMISRGQKVIYGSLEDVKNQYANFKCTIRGKNDAKMLEQLADVQRVERNGDVSVAYLAPDVHVPSWLRELPENLNIHELSIDRISLHEIFIDVATDRHLVQDSQEGGKGDAK